MLALYYMAIVAAVLTILGAPIMKCFAWRVPLLFVAVYFVWAVILAVGVMFKVYPTQDTGLYALIGMCPAAGWLITRLLAKTYGTSGKFPAVGARVMLVLMVSAIVVIVVRFWAFDKRGSDSVMRGATLALLTATRIRLY